MITDKNINERLFHLELKHMDLADVFNLLFKRLEKIEVNIMAKLADFELVLAKIDAATSNIAFDLVELKKVIAGAGLDSATEDAVLAKLQLAADKLNVIAASTEDPVPVPPPVVVSSASEEVPPPEGDQSTTPILD